ncbi:MAG TPA: GMC family oxidoreductase, partial [Longimicrobiales bacterium]|nr:GMC family oxidoreductase [Longimicrobiales bacterium]
PRLADEEFTGRELEMARALYAEGGGVLTEQGTLTLAWGEAYGGSTVVYTGTSLLPPERVVRAWGGPGIEHADLSERAGRYAEENEVHLLPEDEINENNRLFVEGCRAAGYEVEQFPVNVRGCLGSSLCNLGCPNQAKMGTNRIQLPEAERRGVEVVTRARVRRIRPDRSLEVVVSEREPGGKGEPSSWEPGEYRVRASSVVSAGGAVGTPALLLRSGFGDRLPRLGEGFTCHPAHILVAEHEAPITNDLGHPKSFYVDRAEEERYVLETCMYFPFVTAKNMAGFGPDHSRFMRAFPRLQMILVLACDRAVEGNRVTVDRDGEPRIHYEFTDEVVRALVEGTRASARIFFAAGALRVHAPEADPPTLERGEADWLGDPEAVPGRIRPEGFLPGKIPVSAAHLMGGCAMGSNAADSVTDHRGRVHGLPWLRVADASLFPDSVEINPYLTIMALADRVAEGIRADAGELLGAA